MLTSDNIYYVLFSSKESVGELEGSFANLIRNYHQSTKHNIRIKNDISENGFTGKLTGKISRFGLSYNKKLGKINAEKVFKSGKDYVLVKRDSNNFIKEKVFYNKDYRWLKTEYYSSLSVSSPEIIIDRSEEADVLRMQTKSESGFSSALLYPSPYLIGKAEQSILNAKHGTEYVLMRSASGDFCYTAKEDADARKETAENLEDSTLILMNTWEVKDGEIAESDNSDDNSEELLPLEEESGAGSLPMISSLDIPLSLSDEIEEETINEENEDNCTTEVTEEKSEESKTEIKALIVENGEIIGDASEKTVPEEKAVSEALSSENGYLYTGRMVSGMREGRGRTDNSNGITVFDGSYHLDKKEGFGISYFESGEISYAGNWEKGKKNGMGISFRASDHALNITNWNDGKPGDNVTLIDPEGNLKFSGIIENGKKNGTGIAIDSETKAIYVGNFNDNEISGNGSLFNSDGILIYNGQFENGKKNGSGTEFDENGQIVYSGEWKDDKYLNGILYQKIK